jgi:hypothetical protein
MQRFPDALNLPDGAADAYHWGPTRPLGADRPRRVRRRRRDQMAGLGTAKRLVFSPAPLAAR